MTFGIVPTAPETGYGYIECGQELDGLPDAFAIKRFVEKPDLPRAQAYLASGDFFWNSGMFLLPVAATLEAYRRHAPAVLSAVDAALGQCSSEGDTVHPDAGLYAAIPAEPFDTAIMENLDNAGVVPSDIGWSDVGSWQSLWQVAAKDPAHNATRGSVLGFDNEGCYLRSDGRLLMAFGLRGIAVIDSDDAIAVFPRRDHQRVREAVEHLRSRGRAEADRSVGSAVATITLNAGEALTAPPAGTPAGGYWYLKRGSVEVEGAGRTHPKRLEAGKCAPMAWSGSGTIRAVGDGPVLLLSFGPDPSVADD
jgi:mannose-1-phosphate guanylyltransferase/mannose-6-phosphate isomerase